MPLLSFGRKKNVDTAPEITSQGAPLIYAQPSYTSSQKDPVVQSPPPDIRPATHKAITSDVFADVTYYREQQAKAAAAAKAKADADGVVDDSETKEEPDDDFERPATPPQGNRSLPWESYHDLPADHPVFLYPDDVREKIYKKGIDPVVRAMAYRALLGKKYGDKRNVGKTFSRRGLNMVGAFGTMSMGGAF